MREVMLLLLGWESHDYYSFRVHGQEISRRFWLRRRRLKEFDLRRREKLLYTYSSLDQWGKGASGPGRRADSLSRPMIVISPWPCSRRRLRQPLATGRPVTRTEISLGAVRW
jgi:hypothetical protein